MQAIIAPRKDTILGRPINRKCRALANCVHSLFYKININLEIPNTLNNNNSWK